MEVSDHSAVDDVGESALESAHGFGLGVAALAGVVVELSGPRVAAQLGERHVVEHAVDAPVAVRVEAVSHWFAGAFAR